MISSLSAPHAPTTGLSRLTSLPSCVAQRIPDPGAQLINVAVLHDFSPCILRELPPKRIVVEKKQQLLSHLQYVPSRHDETVHTVLKLHDLRKISLFNSQKGILWCSGNAFEISPIIPSKRFEMIHPGRFQTINSVTATVTTAHRTQHVIISGAAV